MNKIVYCLVLIVLLFQLACKKDKASKGTFTVKGSTNVVNAGVTLRGTQVYQTTANNVGDFAIANVAEDNYTLIISKESADSSFISNNLEINVNSDTVLATLLLPDPVKLYPSNNIGSNSIRWSWTKFNLPEYFYEYKVYRKKDRGLDETTGELAFVGTDINDTIFTDNGLLESTDYYYRVYVTNKFGKLGGSNIQFAKTQAGNLIANGSFETFDNLNIISDWKYNSFGSFITDNTAPDGSHVLAIDLPVYHYLINGADVFQNVNISKLLPDIKYTLSAYVKVIDLHGNADLRFGFTDGSNVNYQTQRIVVNASTPKNVWTKVSTDFYTNNSSFYPLINFAPGCTIPYNNEPYRVLIDDIKLQKAD